MPTIPDTALAVVGSAVSVLAAAAYISSSGAHELNPWKERNPSHAAPTRTPPSPPTRTAPSPRPPPVPNTGNEQNPSHAAPTRTPPSPPTRTAPSPRPPPVPPASSRPPPPVRENMQLTTTPFTEDRRAELKRIAEETLSVIRKGSYTYKGVDHILKDNIKEARAKTTYYAPDSSVVAWRSPQIAARLGGGPPAHVSVLQISTLDGARLLESVHRNMGTGPERTGVLNFASATLPGGGFKNGAEAQEESLARASTLYPTLCTAEADHFYALHRTMQHRQDAQAFYTHAMIYSPGVRVFRDDDGVYTYPFDVDVVSCAAVNAGEARKTTQGPVAAGLEVEIEQEMNERMGRILFVFEQREVRNLVLGTFGTGVFRNNVMVVARLWAHLLITPHARFKNSFDRIIFAITGEETFAEFQSAFDAWGQSRHADVPAPSKNGNSSKFSLIQF